MKIPLYNDLYGSRGVFKSKPGFENNTSISPQKISKSLKYIDL